MIAVLRRAIADFINYRFLHGVCAITIALSVFIVSAFSLFFINAGGLMKTWQQGIRIIVYLDGNVDATQRTKLIDTVRSLDGVKSVSYVSSADAFSWLKNQIGQQSTLLDGLTENPLPDSLDVRLGEAYLNIKNIESLAGRIRSLTGVDDVEYAQKWLQRFSGVYSLFKITGTALVSLIFLAIIFIVANTIRLILYSRNEEIEITRIIGADDAFIKHPLYIEGALLGLVGGILGLSMLSIVFAVSMPSLKPSGVLPFFQIRFIPPGMMVGIVLSSMIVGWLGCFFSIRRFLKV